MSPGDDIPHLKQMQAKQGFAIGGIKSCLKGFQRKSDDLERKIFALETKVYAMAIIMAVFYCVFFLGNH